MKNFKKFKSVCLLKALTFGLLLLAGPCPEGNEKEMMATLSIT